MLCIYHSKDLDGLCSAAIVLKKYPDCTLIGWDYGDPIPELLGSEDIMMVDISFKMEIMHEVAKRHKLTWIDHHASARKDYIEYFGGWGEAYFTYIYGDKRAACEVTWKYLFWDLFLPYSVELLSKYDTWRGNDTPEWEEQILPFQYGVRAKCITPQAVLHLIENDSIFSVVTNGKIIIEYTKKQNEKLSKSHSFVRQFQGYRVLCLNTPFIDSDTMESFYDPTKHDLMLSFCFVGNRWSFSLRSVNEIDCSVLAKNLGGGGHARAAGFEVKHLSDAIAL